MEKNLAPFCLSILIPIHYILKQHSKSWITIVLVVFVFGVNLVQIYKVGLEFTERTEKVEKLLDVMAINACNKGVFSAELYHYSENIGIWSLPYETLMLSRLKSNKSISIFPALSAQKKLIEIGAKNVFLGADFFPPLPINELRFNKVYFNHLNGNYCDIDSFIKQNNQ
jgi:hypothetical protein